MRLDPSGEPGVVVVVTGGGDEHLDATALALMLSTLEPGIDVVVIVGETSPADMGPFTAAARAGGVAARGEPSVDAIKRIHEGLVVATLDRSRVVRARLPLGASPAVLTGGLAALSAGVGAQRQVRVADLVARFDPGVITFV